MKLQFPVVVKERGEKMVKIVLRDVDKDYLKPIIDYIYSGWFKLFFAISILREMGNVCSRFHVLGKIELTFDNLKQVLRNAEKLKVEELISDCNSFVEQKVTASNCIRLIVSAKEMGREDIEAKACNFFLVSTLFWSCCNGILLNWTMLWESKAKNVVLLKRK